MSTSLLPAAAGRVHRVGSERRRGSRVPCFVAGNLAKGIPSSNITL